MIVEFERNSDSNAINVCAANAIRKEALFIKRKAWFNLIIIAFKLRHNKEHFRKKLI